jgi:hypothetical protein
LTYFFGYLAFTGGVANAIVLSRYALRSGAKVVSGDFKGAALEGYRAVMAPAAEVVYQGCALADELGQTAGLENFSGPATQRLQDFLESRLALLKGDQLDTSKLDLLLAAMAAVRQAK